MGERAVHQQGENRSGGVGIAAAIAVAAALSMGTLTGCNSSGSAKADAGATQAPVSTSTSAPAPASSSPSTPPVTPAGGTVIQPSGNGALVGSFYGAAELSLASGTTVASPASDFQAASIAAKYWNTGTSKATPAAFCGAPAATLAIVADGGPGSVTVSLYTRGKLASQEARVTVDPATRKISAIACAPATPPSFAGTAALVRHFAVDVNSTDPKTAAWPAPAKSYAPKSQDGPSPWDNFDMAVCSQYPPQTWVLYAPISTTSGSAWQFFYDGNTSVQDVFVDPQSGSVERPLCYGFPAIPAPDPAAAGKTAADGGPDPATRMVDGLFAAYISERSQVSAGAVPTDEMAPYFASQDAYTAALNGTGKYPFLCSGTAPDTQQAGTPAVSGSTETVEVSFTHNGGAPQPNAPVLGRAKVVVDLTTMKITGITCA